MSSTSVAASIPRPAPETPVFVSVAVVVKNESRHIGACLSALMRQDYPGELFEVLVVDGGSSDQTVPIVEGFQDSFPNLRLILCPGCSYPAGLNIAVQQARGGVWAFVDGHATVQDDYLSKNVRYLRETGAACVGGVICTTGEGYFGTAIAHALRTPFGAGNAKFRFAPRYLSQPAYVDTVPYGAYRKKLVLAAGCFDETRLRSADIDLNYRIRALGGTFYLAPDICTRYYSRSTLRSMMIQAFANGYPLVKTLRAASLRHFVPALFVAALAATLVLSPFALPARLCFGAIVASYLLLDLYFSAVTSGEQGWRYLPALLLTYPLLHLSYGVGSLAGASREALSLAAPPRP